MAISEKETYRWGRENDDVISTVISGVARFKGVDSVELSPLYDVIDPDALEAILDVDSQTECRITFDYCGVRVELDSSGECTVTEQVD